MLACLLIVLEHKAFACLFMLFLHVIKHMLVGVLVYT